MVTSLSVFFGILFAAGGLVYTARTWETSQESQVTDRYTKAVEQLSSAKIDGRLGGIYALERLANDSPRDHQTIYDVLTAFVREHDPGPGAPLPEKPATDIQAALTVIGRRDATLDREDTSIHPGPAYGQILDLRVIRVKGANLIHADLTSADLADANLTGADLTDANLPRADLTDADLADAYLTRANLTTADLTDANLIRASPFDADLTYADLIRADLTSADLADANLTDANLTNANLRTADLTDAELTGADLTGADLRGITGLSEAAIRKVAKTDRTLFGPMPTE
ncbi:pentapeptide repeat-containing protein [Nonomuraea sp. NPDC049141]|uniref:pentapeptide repeat-containing protein n=1 Tax=Nonomuraea sp. NPDC049141 TaxID=3155500 RepID=UPI0033E4D462